MNRSVRAWVGLALAGGAATGAGAAAAATAAQPAAPQAAHLPGGAEMQQIATRLAARVRQQADDANRELTRLRAQQQQASLAAVKASEKLQAADASTTSSAAGLPDPKITDVNSHHWCGGPGDTAHDGESGDIVSITGDGINGATEPHFVLRPGTDLVGREVAYQATKLLTYVPAYTGLIGPVQGEIYLKRLADNKTSNHFPFTFMPKTVAMALPLTYTIAGHAQPRTMPYDFVKGSTDDSVSFPTNDSVHGFHSVPDGGTKQGGLDKFWSIAVLKNGWKRHSIVFGKDQGGAAPDSTSFGLAVWWSGDAAALPGVSPDSDPRVSVLWAVPTAGAWVSYTVSVIAWGPEGVPCY